MENLSEDLSSLSAKDENVAASAENSLSVTKKDELSKALSYLNGDGKQERTDENVRNSLIIIRKELLNQDPVDKEITVEYLLTIDALEKFCDLVGNKRFSASTITILLEIIAEIAKIEIGRKAFTSIAIVIPILNLLTDKDFDLLLQGCRALANICFNNDSARNLVKRRNGMEKLIDILKSLLAQNNVPDALHTCTSGFLLNLTDTSDDLHERAIEAGVIDVVLQYLAKFVSDMNVVSHCLLVLACLSDNSIGREKILTETILMSLLDLFDKPLSDDVIDSMIELFGNLCNTDSAKLQLTKMGLCDKVVQLVKKHINCEKGTNDPNPKIFKTVPELLVQVLADDESMEHCYQDGQGFVFKEALLWLKIKNEILNVGGALVAGNFARNDSNCIQMVNYHVVEDLLNIIENHTGTNGDIKVQHAVLSTFKNLAVPVENKIPMIILGVPECLITMMHVETFPVVFKLLGTMRMLIDKQEDLSKTVGKNRSFIERLSKWSRVEDHPGVKGESTRLLAWLAKYSNSEFVLMNIYLSDALPPLIDMILSVHPVMQNEALLAVRLVSSFYISAVYHNNSTQLLSNLHFALTLSVNIQAVTENALKLIIVLINSENFLAAIKDSGIYMALETILYNDNEFKDMANDILSVLNQ